MEDPFAVPMVLRDFQQINFVRIVFILVAAWLLIRLETRLADWLGRRLGGRFRLYILPWVPVVRLAILILALVLIVPLVIEPTMQNLFAISGATALALAFAVKDYVSSLIGGIATISERPYRPGDWVQIGEAYGEVQSVGLRALRLVTPDDTVVNIPHLKFWTTSIYNANDGKRDLQCVGHFYLDPHHDGVKVRQKLYDVALTSPYLNMARPVVVVVKEEDWGTHYRIRAYPLDSRDQFQFISDLTVRGKAALLAMGVTLGWRPVNLNNPPMP
jgi:small conductance mechanosensitive channel